MEIKREGNKPEQNSRKAYGDLGTNLEGRKGGREGGKETEEGRVQEERK